MQETTDCDKKQSPQHGGEFRADAAAEILQQSAMHFVDTQKESRQPYNLHYRLSCSNCYSRHRSAKVLEHSGVCRAVVLHCSVSTETAARQIRVVGTPSCVLFILRRSAAYLLLNNRASPDYGKFGRHLPTEDNSIPAELLGQHLNQTVRSNKFGVPDQLYCSVLEYVSRPTSYGSGYDKTAPNSRSQNGRFRAPVNGKLVPTKGTRANISEHRSSMTSFIATNALHHER